MTKILDVLKSRTVLTIVLLFLINGVAGVQEFIPAEHLALVNAFLSALAIYFRVNVQAKL